jgi:hypothetical protein
MQNLSGRTLVDATTGSAVPLRSGRGPRAIFVAHSSDCAGCRAYIAQLAEHQPAIAEWGGRVSVVVCEVASHAALLYGSAPADIQVLADPDADIDAEPAAVVIADEWGEVYFAGAAVANHALPEMREVIEWVRYIAIQCPECEQAEGEWRSVR